MNIRRYLENVVRDAMTAAGVPTECPPVIALSKKPEFGEYQANGAMGAAKKVGCNPRELAEKIKTNLVMDAFDKVEIAGPGFINLHLKNNWLATQLSNAEKIKAETSKTIVIDYSSPNLAKEMHVGHLRSSIIGDTLARLFEYLGHNVIRQNHVGDWGTQFGMLLAELEDHLQQGEQASFALKDLETFYQQAKVHFDADPAFADKARSYVVKLQSGEQHLLALWEKFREISLQHAQEVYALLNVSLKPEDIRGESFYNDDLANVVRDLKAKGLAKEDQGAQVVFLEELADKEGNPSVAIVQKSDGGFNYATSDLAAVRFRVNQLKADRIIVTTDARQVLHLQQVFTIARKAQFAPDSVSLEHHYFGAMLGKDGKPFKTRTGGTVKLADLLREAIERAEKVVKDSGDIPANEHRDIARKVGIGAVKYADLCKTRTNDYMFDWDAMLSFEGNTAPYLQYAYTRIQSIFRNAAVSVESLDNSYNISEPQEKALSLKCLQLGEVLEQVAEDCYPHTLCNYLYELASLYMKFYEACPILKDGVTEEIRTARLALCKKVAETLHTGLDILGIEVMDRM